ncbi:MAG: PD-(D/E)XK nuclease family protein, partial [Flavobacteriia bacterium]|nr:PD-(D/E)XK nuclease family protein [Flavobacteriia bacterium]
MEDNKESLKQLLSQINTINEAYKIVKQNTGEDFNLFQILGMETAEVKTHSKFLAELLNPKGSHLQGDIFLKLFLEYLNNTKIDKDSNEIFLLNEDEIILNTEKSNTQVERYIGQKTEITGGRIDIAIEDNEKNLICIENKIYAGEQENQILRYSNYGKTFKKCHSLFLTLDGYETATLNKEDGIAYSISYKKHIIEWLELCKKEAVSLPILRETIGQYINLIKKLTHQTTNKKMEIEIQNLIQYNLESAKLIKENYEETVHILIQKQINILRDCFIKNGFSENDVSVERALRASDGLYVFFKSFENLDIELGINIELENNYFFFVVAQRGGNRNTKDNNSEKYLDIRNLLLMKIGDLPKFNGWT